MYFEIFIHKILKQKHRKEIKVTQKFNYDQEINKFTQEMLNDTLKYQKQYGFNLNNGNVAHNNEADAFRHAYMQAIL